MKIKKLASLLIACVMVLTMAMPAFAEEFNFGGNEQQGNEQQNNNGNGNQKNSDMSRSLDFTGSIQVPTINVNIASGATIILNPYGLKVGTDQNTDPFISDTVHITSQSNCELAISGTFTPTVTGEVKLVDAPAKADTGLQNKLVDKNVFVQVVMGEVAAADTAIEFESDSTLGLTGTSNTYRDRIKKATTIAKFKTFKANEESGLYVLKTAGTAVNFGDTNDSNTKKLPYVLKAGDEAATVLAVRMFGLCEKWVSSPWAATDTVSVAMTLSIIPNSN